MKKHNNLQRSANIKFNTDQVFKEGNDIIVEGWATKEGVNLKGNNVLLSSYTWDGAFKYFGDMVLAFHRQDVASVGKIESYEIVDTVDNKGLKVRVRFFGDNNPLFLRDITEGVLNGFSIGYNVLEDHYDDAGNWIFDKIQLYELSVVHLGANPEAVFQTVMDALIDNKETNNDNNNKETKTFTTIKEKKLMSKELEFNQKDLDNLKPTLDSLTEGQKTLEENEAARTKLLNQINDQIKDYSDGKLPEGMLKAFMDKIRPDFDRINQEIAQAKAVSATKAERIDISTKDLRSLIRVGSMSDKDQRAWTLFNARVNYDSMGSTGSRLIRLRNLHDTAYMQYVQSNARGNLSNYYQSDLYKTFEREVRAFDPILADAMAVGNTGYGAEWNPERWSAEVQEYTRVQDAWVARLPHFENIDKLPSVNGRGKAFIYGEPTTDDSARMKATKYATGVTTPTYKTFGALVYQSQLFNERSIVAAMQFTRNEIGRILADGRSQAFINGDSDGTHMDTGDTFASDDVEVAINGLRRYVQVNGTSVAAGTSGVLAKADLIDAFSKLGKKGNPSECFILAPAQLRATIWNLVTPISALGDQVLTSGIIPPIFGMSTYFDGDYRSNLNASGIYDGTTTDRNSLLIVHAPSFGVFEERPITLEFEKQITNQQWAFVGTARWALEQIRTDESTSGTYSASGIVDL